MMGFLATHDNDISTKLRMTIVVAHNAVKALDKALDQIERELTYVLDPDSKPKMTPPPGMEDAVANPLGGGR